MHITHVKELHLRCAESAEDQRLDALVDYLRHSRVRLLARACTIAGGALQASSTPQREWS
jgi:hypothetical protein